MVCWLAAAPLTAAMPGALHEARVGVHADGRVSMDVRDADLRWVVARLGAVGRVNVVMPDHVQGRVTVRVRNVPWKQALKVVLLAEGLGAQLEGNVLLVDRAEAIRAARCPSPAAVAGDPFCGLP